MRSISHLKTRLAKAEHKLLGEPHHFEFSMSTTVDEDGNEIVHMGYETDLIPGQGYDPLD